MEKINEETDRIAPPDIYVMEVDPKLSKNETKDESKTGNNESSPNPIHVGKNDIVVFVGPNNSGKSQTLRDIYARYENEKARVVVIDSIKLSMPKFKDEKGKVIYSLGPYIKKNFRQDTSDYYRGYNIKLHHSSIDSYIGKNACGCFTGVFAAFAGTEERLTVCNPQNNIDDDEYPSHLIQAICKDQDTILKLSKEFYRSFGIYLDVYRNSGRTTPFKCSKDSSKLEKYLGNEMMSEAIAAYAKEQKEQPSLHMQGDGMRSFAGLLFYLLEAHYRTYFVDEPESFLHPPQARLAGEMLPSLLGDGRQAFIATHSSDFIKGLLDAAKERVKIVRITRDGDNNTFTQLKHGTFHQLWSDTLLRYSNIMDGLFYSSVVICESDSDCLVYKAIYDELTKNSNSRSEVLFVHSHGKDKMHKLVKPLLEMNIDLRVIIDFDFLDSRNTVVCLGTEVGIDENAIKEKHDEFMRHVPPLNNDGDALLEIDKGTFVEEVLRQFGDKNKEREKIRGCEAANIRALLRKTPAFWENVKKYGLDGIENSECKNAAQEIINLFKTKGVFIVPFGELESLSNNISEQGAKHGPQWAMDFLEKHPSLLDENIYGKAIELIKSLGLQ